MAARQQAADRERDGRVRRSGLGGLTLRTAYEDMVAFVRNALFPDSYALSDIFVKQDRLRGLGVLLFLAGLLAMVLL